MSLLVAEAPESKRKPPHPAELMNRRVAADECAVADLDVAAERRVVGEEAIVADHAIVRGVAAGHEHVAIPNARDAGTGTCARRHAAMDGGVLAEDVAVADHDRGGLTVIGEVLRRTADDRARTDLVVRTDRDRSQ